VSWELIAGSLYLYFNVRKQALARAIEERAQGHPVEMNHWEMVGDAEPTTTPVDLDSLIAQAEEAEEKVRKLLDAPTPPLSKRAWREVLWVLSVE